MKMKNCSSLKKENSWGSSIFFKRSINAPMGAADVVHQVSAKGGYGDDIWITDAMIMSSDGNDLVRMFIWIICAMGRNWLSVARFPTSFFFLRHTIMGRLHEWHCAGIDLEGNLLGGWVAHSGPVIKMVVGGGYIFTLANSGGIRA